MNVLIIDDRRALAEALAFLVDAQPDLHCVGVFDRLDDTGCLDAADVVVLTTSGPDPIEKAIRRLRDDHGANVVVLAEELTTGIVHEMADCGVAALVSNRSSAEHVLGAVRSAPTGQLLVDGPTVQLLLEMATLDARAALDASATAPVGGGGPTGGGGGQARLTPREQDVLALLGEGLDPQQIAARLVVSVHTSRGHVKNVMLKLGAHTQLQAVVIALRQGLLPELAHAGSPAAAG